MSEPIEAVPSVDALNSWIRSDSRHLGGNGIHHVVYHYKREALIEATRLKVASHRRVVAKAKCRDCGGTGRYCDCNGYTHDHCYRCHNSGKVSLGFVETVISIDAVGALAPSADLFGKASIVWHTPIDRAGAFAADRHDWPVDECGDWSPHQKGKDLTPDELACHLMLVEASFRRRPQVVYHDFGHEDPYAEYSIRIGETDPSECALCAGANDAIKHGGYGARSGRIVWTAYACEQCRHVYSRHGSTYIFHLLSKRVPTHLITPAIRQWIDTHPAPPKRESW